MAKNSFDEIFLGFCLTLFQKGPIFSVVWTARGNKLQKYFLFAENQDFPLNNSTWLWKVLAKFYYYSMEVKFMDSVCFKRKLAWISLQSGFSLMRVNEILKLAWISIQSGSFLDASKWKKRLPKRPLSRWVDLKKIALYLLRLHRRKDKNAKKRAYQSK